MLTLYRFQNIIRNGPVEQDQGEPDRGVRGTLVPQAGRQIDIEPGRVSTLDRY
jgi:hypothetical protein